MLITWRYCFECEKYILKTNYLRTNIYPQNLSPEDVLHTRNSRAQRGAPKARICVNASFQIWIIDSIVATNLGFSYLCTRWRGFLGHPLLGPARCLVGANHMAFCCWARVQNPDLEPCVDTDPCLRRLRRPCRAMVVLVI